MIDLQWQTNLQPNAIAAHLGSHYSSAKTRSCCNSVMYMPAWTRKMSQQKEAPTYKTTYVQGCSSLG